MTTDFEKIPEYVFELFDQIMYLTPSQARPSGFKCSNYGEALIVAWGWNPPLLEPGSETELTGHGLAAHSWYKHQLTKDESGDQPVDWADFRNGPDGSLLTVAVCKERFGVSGKDLTTDAEAKKHRRKNPAGRGHVYRYCDVSRISNRKSGDN